ncbi:MAG: TonB-dependent receptor [Candidatus Marinimicrobia bacterium]|nr:TonB-dependent receptor [Candidatus Neomarinimicrobiota bacterium]
MKPLFILFTVFVIGRQIFCASISGFIREEATGEPISYANVFLIGTSIGAVSNINGYYLLLDVPQGNYTLVVSMIGYKKAELEIDLEENTQFRQDFHLTSQDIKGEQITVTAAQERFKEDMNISTIGIKMRDINLSPGFIEPDVFRTLKMLPGVQSLNDFSSALYVRGGTPDQNLIMFDGIPVYNPYHLGGVFSTFNTDAIKETKFSAGGFPAEYGGRIGSILNIINKEGNTEEVAGTANISLLSSKLFLEGPLPKNKKIKGSWMLAGRRTYFDALANSVLYFVKQNQKNKHPDSYDESEYIGFPYYFYDMEGKINMDIGGNHRLTFSAFYGDDILSLENESNEQDDESRSDISYLFDWRWGNKMNSLAWRWIANPNLIINSFWAQSRFRFAIDYNNKIKKWEYAKNDTLYNQNENYGDVFDIIKDNTLKTNITWILNKHTIKTGLEHKWLAFNLGLTFKKSQRNDENFMLESDTLLWIKHAPTRSDFYIQDKWQISPLFLAQPGLRFTRHSLHKGINIEPRLNFKYLATDRMAFKLSFGKYVQYLTTANPPDENMRFIDIWLPIQKDYKPASSYHNILGVEYLTNNNLLFRMEGYYKDFDHLLTLKPGEIISEEGDDFSFIRIESINDFYNTEAYAYGLEFLLKKSRGKFQGWLGYTYAQTKWKTEETDWYYPKYDRTHTLNLVANYILSESFSFGTTLSYASGNPYTPVLGKIEIIQERRNWTYGSNYITGKKNSARYPNYFRLDLSLRNRKEKQWGYREWYFQIINVTNHLNILQYIYDDFHNEGRRGVKRFGIPMFPITPTFGIKLEF